MGSKASQSIINKAHDGWHRRLFCFQKKALQTVLIQIESRYA